MALVALNKPGLAVEVTYRPADSTVLRYADTQLSSGLDNATCPNYFPGTFVGYIDSTTGTEGCLSAYFCGNYEGILKRTVAFGADSAFHSPVDLAGLSEAMRIVSVSPVTKIIKIDKMISPNSSGAITQHAKDVWDGQTVWERMFNNIPSMLKNAEYILSDEQREYAERLADLTSDRDD